MNEPLVQTQVIPYLRELVKGGHELTLLTFEPGDVDEQDVKAKLEADGIEWQWLRYHKRLSVLATAWDIFLGALFVRRFISAKKPDILHGRVHVPTLMAALARKVSTRKPKILFDIRGFFPEEYTDAGVWPEGGILYRTAKRVEQWLLKESDGFVVLTEKARDILFRESRESGSDKKGRPVEVIPCCVDLRRFADANAESRSEIRKTLGIEGRRVIVYVGSFGGWYLTDEMLDFLKAARDQDPNVFALIFTQRGLEQVDEKLRMRGFEDSDRHIGSVLPSELPRYLCAADVAISFIKACYSKQSSSPTKIAEYLACGLPIVANRGVGDVDDLLESYGVGSLLASFDTPGYLGALDDLTELRAVSRICVETANIEFDLEKVGGVRYRRLYSNLLIRGNGKFA